MSLSQPADEGTEDSMKSSSPDRAQRLRAILLMCAAIASFALLDAAAKFLAARAHMPVAEVVWLRFAAHVAFSLVLLWPMRPAALLRSARPGLQSLRGLLMLGATGFNFIALKYLQLDQTITMFFLAPLIVAALAGPLLGEWVGWRRLLAIMAGFAGIILVFRPGVGGVHWAIVFSLGATLSYALYNIATRHLAAFDPPEVTQFHTPLAGLVLAAPFAFFDWVWPPDAVSWLLVVAMGVTGGLGHWLLILAHQKAPAAILAPFGYTGLFHMVALGYFIFGDVPSGWTLAGGAVVIASGLYLIWQEQRAPLRADSKRPPASPTGKR